MDWNQRIKKLVDLGLPITLNVADIGARGGLLDPWATLPCNVNGYLFEPDPNAYVDTKASADNKTIHFVRTGLAEKEGSSQFYVQGNDDGSAFMPSPTLQKFSKRHWELRSPKSVIEVDCQSLDSVLPEEMIDVIKIDTQGSEHPILAGGKSLLERCSPILFLETWCHPVYLKAPLEHEVQELLNNVGYELWATEPAALWGYRTAQLDTPFTRTRLIGNNLLMSKCPYEMRDDLADAQKIARAATFVVYGFFDAAFIMLEEVDGINSAKNELWRWLNHQYEGQLITPRIT